MTKIPEGYNAKSWADAMARANKALHFVPLKIKNKKKLGENEDKKSH